MNLFPFEAALRKSTPGPGELHEQRATHCHSKRRPESLARPRSCAKIESARCACGGTAALTLGLRERGFDAIGADIDPEAAIALAAIS